MRERDDSQKKPLDWFRQHPVSSVLLGMTGLSGVVLLGGSVLAKKGKNIDFKARASKEQILVALKTTSAS